MELNNRISDKTEELVMKTICRDELISIRNSVDGVSILFEEIKQIAMDNTNLDDEGSYIRSCAIEAISTLAIERTIALSERIDKQIWGESQKVH